MWPFESREITKKTEYLVDVLRKSSRDESRVLSRLIASLMEGEGIDDSYALEAVYSYFDKMQSNCDSVAQGQIAIASEICLYKPALAVDLFERPFQALYYLGIETEEQITKYLNWFLYYDEPYLGRGSVEGYEWLRNFSETGSKEIKKAFKNMYEKEDNDWRDDAPEILKS